MKSFFNMAVLLITVSVSSCSGGGNHSTGGTYTGPGPSTGGTTGSGGTTGTGGGGSSTYGTYMSVNILASEFVSALNNVDGTYSTKIELYTNETLRSKTSGQEQWFVIWDAKFSEYKAVSLPYVRSIVYYDYYSNNNAVAKEFRNIEYKDIQAGNLNGDYYGNDYEVVNLRTDGYYEGKNSGYLYEDEAMTTDVSLLLREQEQKKFFEKAAKVSFTYSLGLETSMSMVSLGSKIEKMLSRTNGELTEKDQLAVMGDLEKLTGVSFNEFQNAAIDRKSKDDVLKKIADKLGTSAQNLEQKILPEVFGVTI